MTQQSAEQVAPADTAVTAAAGAFAERIFGIYRDGMIGLMIDLGHRVGMFEAATQGPATSAELAARAGSWSATPGSGSARW